MNELTVERYQSRRRKPGPTAKYRAKRKRADDQWRLMIRARCVVRDGYCKFSGFGGCEGKSEHAHLEEKRRAYTRGMEPEERHTMQGSMMLCAKHHQLYDARKIQIATFQDLGANGPMRVEYQGRVRMVGQ